MAQWLGQFTGNTHETRVKDLEATLRKAVHAFKTATSEPERHKKAKSVRNLAKRLLSARRRAQRGWLAGGPHEPAETAPAQEGKETEPLPERDTPAVDQGVLEILAELDAQDAMTA